MWDLSILYYVSVGKKDEYRLAPNNIKLTVKMA